MGRVEDIRDKLNFARKVNNHGRVNILGVLLGEVQSLESRASAPLTDEQFYATVKKMIENNNETLALLASNSPERTVALIFENNVLGEFLPQYLDVDAIKKFLAEVDFSQSKSTGQSVGLAMKFFKERKLHVDGKLVKQCVENANKIGE